MHLGCRLSRTRRFDRKARVQSVAKSSSPPGYHCKSGPGNMQLGCDTIETLKVKKDGRECIANTFRISFFQFGYMLPKLDMNLVHVTNISMLKPSLSQNLQELRGSMPNVKGSLRKGHYARLPVPAVGDKARKTE